MNDFPIKVDNYNNQRKAGNHILAHFDENSIIVYQAYNSSIADQILINQNFHSESCIQSGFSIGRMTWIKTNFLWMMYRSGWATKDLNQARILAFRITRDGFEEILAKAVISKHNNETEAKSAKKIDEVRIQWDPDRLPNGSKEPSGRRAIQLGLRGDMVVRFSKEFILSVYDITEFVQEERKLIENESELKIPLESVYTLSSRELANRIDLCRN